MVLLNSIDSDRSTLTIPIGKIRVQLENMGPDVHDPLVSSFEY